MLPGSVIVYTTGRRVALITCTSTGWLPLATGMSRSYDPLESVAGVFRWLSVCLPLAPAKCGNQCDEWETIDQHDLKSPPLSQQESLTHGDEPVSLAPTHASRARRPMSSPL